MPLRPEDVICRTFSASYVKRGYSEREVDAFLEEVVVELRLLYGRIDELEAAVARNQGTSESSVVVSEREQLEQIRRERADLVADLERLQARYDDLSVKLRSAEAAARSSHS